LTGSGHVDDAFVAEGSFRQRRMSGGWVTPSEESPRASRRESSIGGEIRVEVKTWLGKTEKFRVSRNCKLRKVLKRVAERLNERMEELNFVGLPDLEKAVFNFSENDIMVLDLVKSIPTPSQQPVVVDLLADEFEALEDAQERSLRELLGRKRALDHVYLDDEEALELALALSLSEQLGS
jgi:hypothetical protein